MDVVVLVLVVCCTPLTALRAYFGGLSHVVDVGDLKRRPVVVVILSKARLLDVSLG